MNVLVADDDPISRRVMQAILERNGYSVTLVEDGLSALDELRKPGGARMALVDWMMPGLDGPAVCREVRSNQEEPYRYLLLLTSRQTSNDIVQGLEAGADDYLTKPCRPAELKARLATGRRILELQDKLVEAREAMRHRATRDGLTTLWNRSSILGSLCEALHRTVSPGASLSVLLCDIDHFKRINDRFGHHVGDQVIKEVALRLQASVRSRDLVGRYGGEEFLIVLNDCLPSDLVKHADRIRTKVMAEPISTQAGMLEVSVSIGATIVPHPPGDLSVEAIVKQADKALYEAKNNGRNQVRLAESLALVG